MSTFLHGIGTVQFIDKSAELIDIKNIDITSLSKTGVINYEHQNTLPSQLVGKILKAKRIMSESDCSDEHELYFWKKVKAPYIYIMAELLDDYCDSAKHVAGILKYDRDKKDQNEYAIIWFSVEGSEIPNTRKGHLITRAIARKVTLTSAPCNQACAVELLDNQKSKIKDDFDEIFKSDASAIELFKTEKGVKIYEDFLAKKENSLCNLHKSETKGVPSGWKPSVTQHPKLGAVTSLHHPEHGTVSVHKNPESNKFEVNHAGKIAGVMGKKGVFDNHKAAISHMQKYTHALHHGKVLGRDTVNMSSGSILHKALEAGSTNAAPSTLTNGAAYQVESMASAPKKDWKKRSKEEYERWPHKEKFESFMKARMPHLHEGEIKALGRALALKKTIDLEKSLDSLILRKSIPVLSPKDQKHMAMLQKHPKVKSLHAEHEKSSPTGTRFWVGFKGHHYHDNPGQHTNYADSLSDIEDSVKTAKPCGCKECKT